MLIFIFSAEGFKIESKSGTTELLHPKCQVPLIGTSCLEHRSVRLYMRSAGGSAVIN